jgi:hypothetical protein
MRIKKECVGKGRIIEMSEWDQDFIDLVAPGHITVRSDGSGSFAFGAVEADIDCRSERIGEIERLAFSFAGWDEGDEFSGRGWGVITSRMMEGELLFHQGERSSFRAKKQKPK